ncbi:MAG TPA: exodeoxyribonuclease VII small subunit [Candidatus Saccharimonadales bacterium]|nr:exodeoxyribonuclease VII small subunit [Candidatus Saccharimonadales bacterium]
MASKTTQPSYTELSEELDQVMADLEGGELDIDQAVKCYERGLAIVRQLEAYLKDAENKVTKLKTATLQNIEEIEEE